MKRRRSLALAALCLSLGLMGAGVAGAAEEALVLEGDSGFSSEAVLEEGSDEQAPPEDGLPDSAVPAPDERPGMAPGNGMMPPMQGGPGGMPEMNGQMPGDPQGQQDPNGQPPQMAGGSAPNGQQMPGGQPPQMPGQSGSEGSMPGGMPGQGGPGGMGMGNGQPGGEGMMPGQGGPGGSSAPTEYASANTVTEDSEGESYASSGSGENAVLVEGKTVTLKDVTVEKTGDSNGEDADFYGINAAVLATGGAELTVSGTKVTTDGAHANGIFSYGTGTSVTVSDAEIVTSGNNSGGLMTTGGASMTATNVTVNTSGNSSAAIRSDRGGGTVVVSEGSYTSQGVGSPAVYSTADISVSDAVLTATNSEAVVIEGGNSVTLTNVDASGNNAALNGQSTVNTNVLIYQSMSGDAREGNSVFTMTGGSLTSGTGSMFHVTNVTTEINLTGVTLTEATEDSALLILSADSWGTQGKNGGNATVNFSSQSAEGNIEVDSVSSLVLNLTDSSAYSGAINPANTGTARVTLEAGSAWTLTGDSYLTSFEGDYSSIDLNGYKLYVNGEEIVQ